MALDFDMNDYNSADTLEPVPRGTYRVRVVRIKAKVAFAEYDDRRNYEIDLEIVDGEYQGRPLREDLVLYNGKSKEQSDRARSRLKNLAWATYHEQLTNVEDLQDHECEVEAWINDGIDRKTGEKRFKRRNDFNYIIPDDFVRPTRSRSTPKTNGAAEPKPEGTVEPKPETELNDEIPFG